MTTTGRRVDLRAKPDSYTANPGDVAFDRPAPEELLEIALDTVGELHACGFSQEEIETIAELLQMAAETRRPGKN